MSTSVSVLRRLYRMVATTVVKHLRFLHDRYIWRFDVLFLYHVEQKGILGHRLFLSFCFHKLNLVKAYFYRADPGRGI